MRHSGAGTRDQLLYTQPPVRDVGWYLRTAVYILVLFSQVPLGDNTVWVAVIMFLVLGASVIIRDRLPWVLATLGLLFTFLAEAPIALGMAAVASRSRWYPTLGYSVLGAAILALPTPRLLGSGLSIDNISRSDPSYWFANTMFVIVLPALVGTVRRFNRATTQQRIEFQANQQRLAAEQAIVEERNRIAQEMHDNLGHKLSLLTLQAGALELNPDRSGEQAPLIRDLAKQALDELRDIVNVLGEPTDQLHPQAGLEEARQLIKQSRQINKNVTLVDDLPPDLEMSSAVDAAVFRIIQEGLSNAYQHAPGAAITVTLKVRDEALTVRVQNRPSARPDLGPGTGRGLPSLRERVRALNGTFDAGVTGDAGFAIHAQLPLAGR